jgi:hypothetical protein
MTVLGKLLADARSWLQGHGEHTEAAVQITVPGRCHFDGEGKLRGDIKISYNKPFPTKNGDYGSGAMDGVLMHTMVGNLPGTVAVFNEDRGADSASATFGIAQDGSVVQFGPVGKGWYAWHAVAANRTYYGIEHADNANPDNPLTAEQIAASAQIVEALSAFAGFPLRLANAPGEKGYGTHFMGGAAYGGHSCPDLPPKHVRSQQRAAILTIAAAIRKGLTVITVKADGKTSLHALAAKHGMSASHLLRVTAVEDKSFPDDVAAFINDVFAGRTSATGPVPAGCEFKAPK